MSTKSTVSQKLKISKIGNLFFHSFQKIAQHFGTKTELGYFWRGWVFMSLNRKNPHALFYIGWCREIAKYTFFERIYVLWEWRRSGADTDFGNRCKAFRGSTTKRPRIKKIHLRLNRPNKSPSIKVLTRKSFSTKSPPNKCHRIC